MNLMDLANKLSWMPPRMVAWLEKRLHAVPAVQQEIEKEYAGIMGGLEASLKPYRDGFTTFDRLPQNGRHHDTILQEMEAMHDQESGRWQDGYVSGAVYHGDAVHIEFLNKVVAMNSQSNPLHADLWPSATKFEAEVVSMTAHIMGANQVDDDVCGVVSSGGTDSILLAMKTYRDRARETKGIRRPEMIAPVTAHVAFDKAAQYFNIKMVHVPVDAEYRAEVTAVKKAINRNTIVIVGSAPSFPHGAMDPIAQMAELARQRGIGFHTDACLGGFVLPWAEKLGYDVPLFDFRVPGVTSLSADTHKYGYAAKGTSVLLYRSPELRRFQFYTSTDWPGGMYFSPTFAGSRPGALSAACWAAMVSVGEDGYMQAAKAILETAVFIKQHINQIPELHILGDPLWVIAFGSDMLDIYQVMDRMSHKGWSLNGLYHPACIHIAVTLRHTQHGVAERFIEDLKTAVAHVKANPNAEGGMAPVYGMAATIPLRGMVSELLKRYMDLLYKV